MINFLNALLDGFILQLPGGNTCIFGFELGLMSYKIVLLCILGEIAIMLTKEKKVQ